MTPTSAPVATMGIVFVLNPLRIHTLAADATSLADNTALEDVSIKLSMMHEAGGGLRHSFLKKRDLSPPQTISSDGREGEDDLFDTSTLTKDLPHMFFSDISRESFN